ncbi:MAG: carboxypeptidase regulatory-like domain-containing protein [Ignavibacteria bacterium]|nr:carboxypeptidase regulatory-like domain-containing protein [Ignavibacteria bacterium]
MLSNILTYTATIFTSVIFSASVISCLPPIATTTTPPTPGTIIGRVVDGDTGAPLGASNISTQPGTGSVLTDSAGQYTIDNVQPGSYSLTAIRSGYPVMIITITVSAGNRTRADIALFRRGVQATANQGSIEGRILDAETFRPIIGATISTQPPTNSLLTDSLGRFTLSNITIGNYTINAFHNSYISGNTAVAVLAGQQTRADITLTRVPAGTGTTLPVLPAQPRVSVFASGFSGTSGMAFDVAGNLYVANNRTGTISRVAPDGTNTIFASGLGTVSGLAFDASGNLYATTAGAVAPNTGYISRISPNGTVSTFASNFTNPLDIKFDRAGTMYVSDKSVNGVTRITSSGVRSSFISSTPIPCGLTFDASGNLYLSANDGNTGTSIFRASPNGGVTLFSSSVRTPSGMVFDTRGNLYVGSFLDNTVVRIAPDGTSMTIAPVLGNPAHLIFDIAGNLYVSSYNNNVVYRISL